MTRAFRLVARDQQARFRETLPLPARTPSDDEGRRHGHLLALGREIHNRYPALQGIGGALETFLRRFSQAELTPTFHGNSSRSDLPSSRRIVARYDSET